MFNEQDVLPLFEARLRPVLDNVGLTYEVLAVDDGSTDDTPSVLRLIDSRWPEFRFLRLRRNAGHQAALAAGLDHCSGTWIVTIDVDLQDPPELIPRLLQTAQRDDADVVYAVHTRRQHDKRFKRWSAGLYYRLIRRVTASGLIDEAGDYRLISRSVLESLRSLPERHRVYRLMIPWLGYPSAVVPFERERRAAGTSKYPIHRMTGLALDSITSFTAKPLRVATWLGVLGSVVSLVSVLVAVLAQLFGNTVPGWASVFVAVLFLGAIQLLCLGLLGEYVGRLYSEAQHRPLYFLSSPEAPTPRPRVGTQTRRDEP